VAAKVEEDVDAEAACVHGDSLIVKARRIMPCGRAGGEATGEGIGGRVGAKADDLERGGVERLDTSHGKPANWMCAQRVGEEREAEGPAGVRV